LRAQQLQLSPKLAELLLRCRDHIAVLVECSAEDVDADLQAVSAALLAALKPFQAEAAADSEPAAEGQLPAKAPARVEATGGGRVSGDTWHISVRFSPDVPRHGMDPSRFLRCQRTLGELTHVATISDALPAAADMDPESCYLGFEIDLRSDADKAAIEDAFEFVRELCQLRILPPRSRLQEYMQLIEELPEDPGRLGE